MNSVLQKHNVGYALEKIGDFLRGNGSGVLAGWPETSAKIIVEALQELEREMRAARLTPEASVLPLAAYTARELQKHLKPAPSDIANQNAARVYYRCLCSLIRELRQIEKQLEERTHRAS